MNIKINETTLKTIMLVVILITALSEPSNTIFLILSVIVTILYFLSFRKQTKKEEE